VSQTEGYIFDIRKFSIHDGPGIRTTVFLKGCPLSCWWCHNPESQSFHDDIMLWEQRCIGCGACITACTHNAIVQVTGIDGQNRIVTNRGQCARCFDCIEACTAEARERVGQRMSVQDVMAQIERDRHFYEESGGGVTISGGEPLSQLAFLCQLLQECHEVGLHTAVDTSGYAPWSSFQAILSFTNVFLYDLKHMDKALHQRYTGVSNQRILENLEALAASGANIIVRIPVIPGINDDPENINSLGCFITSLDAVQRVDLLPYHASAGGKYDRLDRLSPLPHTETPSTTQMDEIASTLRSFGIPVKIGG
jgi:pyruvate formate lyase activating enzyme